MTVKVTKDRVEEVMRAMMDADRYQVLVGFPEQTGKRQEGGITNAQLAYIHDKGSPINNIPARPFLAEGIEAVQGQLEAIFEGIAARALANGPDEVADGLEKIGMAAVNGVRAKIVQGPFVPLKPTTIARKGSSRPLIDTGQMRQAVTYVIREK